MESNWAVENLQVIRTLMERSAIYRRALAPMMLLTGTAGTVAALAGVWFHLAEPRLFIAYWLAVSLVTLVGAFLLVRRQALRDSEPVWSPPMRRVMQALLPPLIAGLAAGLALLARLPGAEAATAPLAAMFWLPLGWVVLYGCALNAAGFFMPRGIKLFGWLFIAGGCGLFALGLPDLPRVLLAHGIMGVFFGALHLAYGLYLTFTEARKNET